MPPTPLTVTLTAAARDQRRSETKSRSRGLPPELILIDYLCDRWARWTKVHLVGVGWAEGSIAQKMIEWHALGMKGKRYPGEQRPYRGGPPSGTNSTGAPAGVLLIDALILKLPKPFYRVFMLEYLTMSSPREEKASMCRCSVIEYRSRIKEMLWTLYGFIAMME